MARKKNKCRFHDRSMLAVCFILEGNAGDIPVGAIKETVQKQAKLMKAPLGKRWLSYTNRAVRDLLAKDKWHSSADGGRTVVVSARGRAKYKAARDKYPVPENETASQKAARLFHTTREILRQFDMLEKLTPKEVMRHYRARGARLFEIRNVQGVTPEPSLYDHASDYQGSRRNSVADVNAMQEDNHDTIQSPGGSQPLNTTQTPSRTGSRIDAFGSPRPSSSYPTPSGAHAEPATSAPQGERTLHLTPSTSFETPRRPQQPRGFYPTPDSNDRPRIRLEEHEFFQGGDTGQSPIPFDNTFTQAQGSPRSISSNSTDPGALLLQAKAGFEARDGYQCAQIAERDASIKQLQSRLQEAESRYAAECDECIELQRYGERITEERDHLLKCYRERDERVVYFWSKWWASRGENEMKEREFGEMDRRLQEIEEALENIRKTLRQKEEDIVRLRLEKAELMEYSRKLRERADRKDAVMQGWIAEPPVRTPDVFGQSVADNLHGSPCVNHVPSINQEGSLRL